MTKLTFEKWCEKVPVVVSEEVRTALKSFHDIDVDKTVENVLKQQYEIYLASGETNE